MLSARYIDSDIKNTLFDTGAVIHSIFNHTMNILLENGELITLGGSIPEGKHHVVLSEEVQFKRYAISQSQKIVCTFQECTVGDCVITFQFSNTKKYLPSKKTYSTNDHLWKSVDLLKKMLMASSHRTIYDGDLEALFGKRFIRNLKGFLENPIVENAKSIIGFGEGLTPLGDDILLGYILGRNALNRYPSWTNELLDYAEKKTNLISLQGLKDVSRGYLTASLQDFLEGIFTHADISEAQVILNYGETSGAGILSGFIESLNATKED